MPTKQLFEICACTAVIVGGGCTRPWTASFAPSVDASVDTSANIAAATSPLANRIDRDSVTAQAGEPIDPASAPLELAGVLDQLQQIRAIDPSAEQKLMDQLRRTPADSWPLVAEQFRASLAYREQLVSSPDRLGIPADRAPAEQLTDLDPMPTSESPRLKQFGVETRIDNSTSLPIGLSPTGITPAASSSLQDASARPVGTTSEVVQATLNTANEPTVSSTIRTMAGSESSLRAKPAAVEDWQQLVANAADGLSQSLARAPATTAEVHQHVSLRILRLLAADTEGALEPIPGISPTEQDYWSRQLFALATYMDHHGQPDEKRRAAASVLHLDEAVSHLRELGSLSVRNLSFCKNVYGYGAIEPYDDDVFSPGQQVSLYVEVENYHSKSTEKGFCTLLGSTYEILNDKGARVGGGEIPDVNDCCRSHRRDFHIQYGISLPEALAPGRYQLQLVIKDRQSDKRGTATAAFEIKDSVAGRLNSRDIH